MLTIRSTDGIDLNALEDVKSALAPHIRVEIDERQMMFKSAEPPSWVALVASFETWQLLTGGALGVYLTGIITAAAQDHWRDRAKIFAALKSKSIAPVIDLARALARLRVELKPSTDVAFVVPLEEDDYFGVRYTVAGVDEEALAAETAWFLAQLESIKDGLARMREKGIEPMPPIQVQRATDGAVDLFFLDSRSLKKYSLRIPSNAA